MIDTNLTQQDYEFIDRVLDYIENVEGFDLSPIGASHGIDTALTDAIETDLKLMVENKVWPFGYTRQEVIERLVWVHGTETGLTTTARDINVLEASTFAGDTDQPVYKERKQIIQDYVWDFTQPAYKQIEEAVGSNALATESSYIEFKKIIESGSSYLAIPKEKALDYLERFETWINKSNNIRNALWKLLNGVISEKDFNDALKEYKRSDDYSDQLYEEDII